MKYEFGTASRAARWIEHAAGATRFQDKTVEGEISTAPSRAILAHPGKSFSPETSVEGIERRISTIMPQSDLRSPKTPYMIPTQVEFATAARGCVRRTHATLENSCTAVHHLTKAFFLSKPAEPLLTSTDWKER